MSGSVISRDDFVFVAASPRDASTDLTPEISFQEQNTEGHVMENQKKIMLYCTGKLGDILLMMPVFSAIRIENPTATIDMFCLSYPEWRPKLEQLLKYAKVIDNCVFATKWQCFLIRFLGIGRLFGFQKYDEVYYLIHDCHTLANKIRRSMPFLKSILRKAGVILGAKPFSSDSQLPGTEYRISEQLAWRIQATSHRPFCISHYKMPVAAPLRKEALSFLNDLKFDSKIRFFCVCIGGQPISKWPKDRYIEVLRRVIQQTSLRPVFLGGPEDEDDILYIMKQLPANTAAYAKYCTEDFCKTIVLMESMDFYLGNDTGSIHLAGMAGLPCVGIYSDRNKSKNFYPIGKNHIILKKEGMNCPYRCDKMTTCPIATNSGGGSPCLEQISVEEVVEAVLRLAHQIFQDAQ